MKFKISYFYKIRFFKPWQVPVSTAEHGPEWYHKSWTNREVFKDKNGVINGLVFVNFVPKQTNCRGPENCNLLDPDNCSFLKAYREQLHKVDFHKVADYFQKFAALYKAKHKIKEEIEIIFMVYEAPWNECSERRELVRYFKNNGYDLEEFEEEEITDG